MKIKQLTQKHIKEASELCVQTFLDAEYSYYLQKVNLKGLDEFIDFCSPSYLTTKIKDSKYIFLGAFEDTILLGVSVINIKTGKVLLLFVDKENQGVGIGKALLSAMQGLAVQNNLNKLSVDSTHFGVKFYKANGFIEKSEEKILEDGMIYTPMEKVI